MSMTHTLNIPYMDNHKVKADQLTWREGQGLSADMIMKVKAEHDTPP